MRVSEDDVRHYLTWARNYGEIASFEMIAPRGRRWLIRLPAGATVTAHGGDPTLVLREVVPDEMVLTSREALAFGYGCATAGARVEPRRDFARREWDW